MGRPVCPRICPYLLCVHTPTKKMGSVPSVPGLLSSPVYCHSSLIGSRSPDRSTGNRVSPPRPAFPPHPPKDLGPKSVATFETRSHLYLGCLWVNIPHEYSQ